MIKPIDMSVLPDGMLIEVVRRDWTVGQWITALAIKQNADYDKTSRPALNFWHFNDGTMTLPDGLVVDCLRCDSSERDEFTLIVDDGRLYSIAYNYHLCFETLTGCAFKILGVTSEYGPQLGMEVIEL